MIEFLDVLGYQDAHLVGNSMGGRIAMEIGMLEPKKARSIACLCPATAFSHRPALWLVRLARPELGFLAPRIPRKQVLSGIKQLMADPDRLPDEWYGAAADDFLLTWKSPRARMAFLAAARNIYLDEPFGEEGFWARLSRLEVPSLFVYGEKDPLITARFGDRVSHELPAARVEVWEDGAHVPQIEHPERTSELLLDFFGGSISEELAG